MSDSRWHRNIAVLMWAACRFPDEFTRYRKRDLVATIYSMRF